MEQHKVSLITLFLILILSLCCKSVKSQELNHFGFEQWLDIKVNVNGLPLDNPWVGGLNNAQIGEIDLNKDGSNDLILFDKHGNRILPFVFHAASRNSPQSWYKADFSYRKFFPLVRSIFQMKDYNGDGKNDIFTYTTGGLLVYKNVSDETLSFEKATFPFIRSLQGNVFTNLLVTNVDYPGIQDIDNDSDLDIITFWGLGSFMDLHKNMSQETFGNSDSLLFHKVDNCWGNFAEGAESNEIYLDTCNESRTNDRHTGSTISLLDVNNDQVLDLLLGDVEYEDLKVLINGGSNADARMIEVIDSFPASMPVKIASFPAPQHADIYNDGVPDLLVSPYDPGLTRSAGYNSLWQYQMNDTSLTFITKAFLQDGIIDVGLGAYPVLADIDGDTLVDFFIGNYGQLDSCYYDNDGRLICDYHSSVSYYKNTGTHTIPAFTLVTNDFNNLSELGVRAIYPAFADINSDKLNDMLIGTASGELFLYVSTGQNAGIPLYEQPTRINPVEPNEFLTPAFVDIDSDGFVDFVAGNKSGSLSYYRNVGTLANPQFSFITNRFGHVSVTDSTQSYTGYSAPTFFRDKTNNIKMVVGSESGKLFYYPSIPTNPTEKILPKPDAFEVLTDGIRSSATIQDINNDNYPDMIAGNYAGGVILYKGIIPGPSGLGFSLPIRNHTIKISPNPAKNETCLLFPMEASWKVKITDITGNEIDQIYVEGNRFAYDIKKLKSGLYLVTASQLNNSNQIYSGKMIILQ